MMGPQTFQYRRYLSGGVALLVLVVIYMVRFLTQSSGYSFHIAHKDVTPITTNTNNKSFVIKEKVAAIIENRPLDRLVPLLLHFSAVLGPEWPIVLFTTQTTIPESAPLHRLIQDGRLEIKPLPSDTSFKSRSDVSNFLTTSWLYEQLAPAGSILLFQSDSILCAQSALRVENFLEYDFIGAPIAKRYGRGYNGGLSIRNRTMMLEIVKQSDWRADVNKTKHHYTPTVGFEDQWFYGKVKEYPGSRLPDVDVAKTFAVETIWYDKPLGYHQITRWHADKIPKVDLWCPEHRLASAQLMKH